MDLRFYLDENVPVAIAAQLNRRGIEAVTARDLKAPGASDQNHLQRAIVGGYVFCTHDADFVDMALQGVEHTGIVFGNSTNTALVIGCAIWSFSMLFLKPKKCTTGLSIYSRSLVIAVR